MLLLHNVSYQDFLSGSRRESILQNASLLYERRVKLLNNQIDTWHKKNKQKQAKI